MDEKQWGRRIVILLKFTSSSSKPFSTQTQLSLGCLALICSFVVLTSRLCFNTFVAQYIRGDTIAIPMYLFLKKKENYSINRLTESIASTQFHR